ncbi:MAG: HAMP domain-containing sensor histidine kinase [Spirochaetales bacterium]
MDDQRTGGSDHHRAHSGKSGKINLLEILTHISEINRVHAQKKQISLSFLPPKNPCWIQGDKLKLEQVFQNLVGNALKFTRPGGKVHIFVEDTDSAVSVRIQDTGIGIPKEEQSKLFTSAHKGRPGTLGERSTGFGLLIVKRIVEGHRGKLEFESTEGIGTTFTVTLPKEQE